ncbi:MAG: hydrogenase iron-sulfur subunit [Candidatus Freyarchaeota archaeon]
MYGYPWQSKGTSPPRQSFLSLNEENRNHGKRQTRKARVIEAVCKGCGACIADCHYIDENANAEKEVKATMKILDLIGLGSERLRLEWISALGGMKFAEVVRDFT